MRDYDPTGMKKRASQRGLELTSKTLELLISLAKNGSGSLREQIESQLRSAIRSNRLRPGALVPSTRDLAKQVGVSRPTVVEAYSQLAAEGYLTLRQGARPRVSQAVKPLKGRTAAEALATKPPRVDFRPGVPDLKEFPRLTWLRAIRETLSEIPDAELGYGDPLGVDALRATLADYLGRVRGVVAEAAQVVITTGYTQASTLVFRALAATGYTRLALENPTNPDYLELVKDAGLKHLAIPVDEAGMVVSELERANADAAVLTPAHQFPAGAVLSGERRTELLRWLRGRKAFVLEDDYDAEIRYDRAAIGALQGLEPERVIYAGTTSKTLAPALRLGWLVLPHALRAAVEREKRLADFGGPRIEQHAFARFIARGDYDRHLRRMRSHYRLRRDALLVALAEMLPEAQVMGIAAGLHAAVRLPPGDDEEAIAEEALRRGIAIGTLAKYRARPGDSSATLLLNYGRLSPATIRRGLADLAAAVRTVRRGSKVQVPIANGKR
jgi:GntR family transcriptional regulator/MocR family aminotransferase